MTIIGIVCEYNPLHIGHIRHIEHTRSIIGGDSAVVCVMSGNYVQRGDVAVFSKHARAEAAVRCGADLVIELPLPYALASAERFARAGVYLLGSAGAKYISFGSESGDIAALRYAAQTIVGPESEIELKKWLGKGISYAAAFQKSAETLMGECAELFKTPNNLLAIEYIKAINTLKLDICPFTIKREGSGHNDNAGCSAAALRNMLRLGISPWEHVPEDAMPVYMRELDEGRGPMFLESYETAILSRLRAMTQETFAALPAVSEGIDKRFWRYAVSEPSLLDILEKTKTKRYAMSRIRRLLLCAVLGVSDEMQGCLPPYIRVLAMNTTGMKLLKAVSSSKMPVITKPASARKLPKRARRLFELEAAATDFYVLGRQDKSLRAGGQEWTESPRII